MSDSSPRIDPALTTYATATQATYIEAVNQHGSVSAAAVALGVHRKTIQVAIAAAQKKARDAATNGMGNPPGFVIREISTALDADGEVTNTWLREGPSTPFELGGVGEGEARDGEGAFLISGVSTLFGPDGEQRAQWVKTRRGGEDQLAAVRAAIEAMAEDLPRVEPIAAPQIGDAKLLNLFTLTDAHVGMLAWEREGGANWDLRKAEDTLVAAFADMIARAPRAGIALLNQLGDFLHFDGLDAVTPTSRHLLDADGRFRKITKTAIRILRRIIDMLLATHGRVHVVNAEGNHDLASSGWLAMLIAAIYENEPRVTVDDSPLPFYRFVFGNVFLGFHHGHTKAKHSLPMLFSQQFRREWGDTEHSYIHTGHRHHFEEADKMGVRLVEHATLAARDAYAARHGYHAARQALTITYHADFGEWSRLTVSPEMLQ